uniref:HhH-GPD domain-containing protein n=1 Tax=Thermogladius calderae TaxID=1200300 RepID=A0A7J3XY70_9CREN
MRVKGINYGLSLYSSYTLPLFDLEEVSGGFIFRKRQGAYRGLVCRFDKRSFETECKIPRYWSKEVAYKTLGLDKHFLYRKLASELDGKGLVDTITLMYSPSDKTVVAYTIYLSQNTSYHTNTVKWVRQFLETGVIEARSYQVSWFMENMNLIRESTSLEDPLEEAARLLTLRGVGVKSSQAYLLYAHGLTEYAPLDRHYKTLVSEYLDLPPPDKNFCLRAFFNCEKCPLSGKCMHSRLRSRLGYFNGVLQSIVYIAGSLKKAGGRGIVEVLVGGFEDLSDLLLDKASLYLSRRLST